MAIKARPYGGKPGIAVAKETNSHLLTVWPLKLWGALAPVAPRRKTVWKIKGKETISVIQFWVRRNLHAVQSLDKCMATFLRHTWQLCWFTQTEVWLCSNMLALFQISISHEAPNVQLHIKSISYEHNITLIYSLSITAVWAEPSGGSSCSAHHISFVGR